jgi:coenzyme F420-reducing hydrogenase delta subunit/ferredoxin
MCTGRIDLSLILRAFTNGADGVFIIGCRLGECNYTTHGNYSALNKVLLCKKILEHVGLNPERLRIEFMSSGEGILFTETMNSVVKKVKELGPLGVVENIDKKQFRSRLQTVTKLVPYINMIYKEKLAIRPANVAEYDRLYTSDEINRLIDEAVSYYIDPAKCQACMICMRKCPVDAISGGKDLVHIIDQEKCIKCGTCFESCPPRFTAIRKIVSAPVPPPPSEESRIIVRKT